MNTKTEDKVVDENVSDPEDAEENEVADEDPKDSTNKKKKKKKRNKGNKIEKIKIPRTLFILHMEILFDNIFIIILLLITLGSMNFITLYNVTFSINLITLL